MNSKTDNEVKRFWRASCRRSDSKRNARLNTQRKIITAMWACGRMDNLITQVDFNSTYETALFDELYSVMGLAGQALINL